MILFFQEPFTLITVKTTDVLTLDLELRALKNEFDKERESYLTWKWGL